MSETSLALKSPLTVIIPVFNAAKAFGALLDGLDGSIGPKAKNLRFIVIDDASTDRKISLLMKRHAFFDRRNVSVLRNKKNLGYVKTVNAGLKLVTEGSDVLLLNSDTLIRGSSIRILQDVANRNPRIASVTPLTNNGALASLFNWPLGGECPFDLDYDELCSIVESARLRTPSTPAPSGVGFCIYLKAKALSSVGPFDAKAFGRGYGEEEDWCQRATLKGFRHVITPETYVAHSGTQSFEPGEKIKRIASSQRVLKARFPNYKNDLNDYFGRNPLGPSRSALLLEMVFRSLRKSKSELVTFILPGSDPHAMNPTAKQKRRTNVCQIFPPLKGSEWIVRFYGSKNRHSRCTLSIEESELSAPLSKLLGLSRQIHVHHGAAGPD